RRGEGASAPRGRASPGAGTAGPPRRGCPDRGSAGERRARSERQELERRPGDVREIDLDPYVRVFGQLALETLGQLLGTFLREDTDGHVPPASMGGQTLGAELLFKGRRRATDGEVRDHVPVEGALPFRLLRLRCLA